MNATGDPPRFCDCSSCNKVGRIVTVTECDWLTLDHEKAPTRHNRSTLVEIQPHSDLRSCCRGRHIHKALLGRLALLTDLRVEARQPRSTMLAVARSGEE